MGIKTIFASYSILVIVVMAVVNPASGESRLPPWSRDINDKLCEPGAHTNLVVFRYFDCFSEKRTPGGWKFVECQQEVYGKRLYNERNVDMICGRSERLPLYLDCVTRKLTAAGNELSTILDRLNECQGAVLGVPNPEQKS